MSPSVFAASVVLDKVAVDTLKPAPGSRHRHKRKGRGIAAGQGASCGFGMRGQKSRSGPGVRAGFEGGQTALYRRLPKLVGRPMGPGHTKKVSQCLCVGRIWRPCLLLDVLHFLFNVGLSCTLLFRGRRMYTKDRLCHLLNTTLRGVLYRLT